jgi:hypothetical protein
MERAARTPLHPLQHHDSTGMHDDQIMKDGPRAARILLTPGSKTRVSILKTSLLIAWIVGRPSVDTSLHAPRSWASSQQKIAAMNAPGGRRQVFLFPSD